MPADFVSIVQGRVERAGFPVRWVPRLNDQPMLEDLISVDSELAEDRLKFG